MPMWQQPCMICGYYPMGERYVAPSEDAKLYAKTQWCNDVKRLGIVNFYTSSFKRSVAWTGDMYGNSSSQLPDGSYREHVYRVEERGREHEWPTADEIWNYCFLEAMQKMADDVIKQRDYGFPPGPPAPPRPPKDQLVG